MKRTHAEVDDLLRAASSEALRADAGRLIALMSEVTGAEPEAWSGGIIGFGDYHYRYPSGHEGDAPLVAFAVRRRELAIYLTGGYAQRYPAALARLGPHRAGQGCLYLRSLDAVSLAALRELVDRTVRVKRGVDRASRRTLNEPRSR